MKVLDALKLGVEAYANARKGNLTEEQLNVDLATDTLEDGTVIEYESLEVGVEVLVIVEGENPRMAEDGTYKLSDGQSIVVVEGKISEIIPMEAEVAAEVAKPSPAVELSEQYLAVVASKVVLSDQIGSLDLKLKEEIAKSVKLESEKVALTAQVELLQKLNDQKLPLENAVKLENEKPLTTYEKMVLKQ
jgi:hypothetical protein